MGKKIIVNENQLTKLMEEIAGSEIIQGAPARPVGDPMRYPVNPQQVLVVKDFLDKTFRHEMAPIVGDDGMPSQVVVITMMSPEKVDLKQMFVQDLEDLLVEKFKNIFADPQKRERFIKQVVSDWCNDLIGTYGNLSKNYF